MSHGPLKLEESINRNVVRFLMRIPHRVKLLLSGRAPLRDGEDTLHPELQLILTLRKITGVPQLSDVSPEIARRHLRRELFVHRAPQIPVGYTRDFSIAGPTGEMKVRHYAPEGSKERALPLVVYYHGGGFVLCDIETHDAPCRLLCQRAGVHVLSVDYRLAPEHPFPAAVDDSLAAFLWAVENAERLGTAPDSIAVGGDSAGANLAAVVSQLCRDKVLPLPAAQLLLYPAVGRREIYDSMSRYGEGVFLSRHDIEWFENHYKGTSDFTDPRRHPLFATDFSGLPPALMVTSAFDPLRDEGEVYAQRLREAGTPAETMRMKGMAHGFVNLIEVSPACREALGQVAERFARMIEAREKKGGAVRAAPGAY